MSKSVDTQSVMKLIFAAISVFCLASTAHAQNLGISGNQVTITVPGTSFSEIATLSSGGAVSAVDGVPTSGTLDVPTFSFTLEQTGAASTTGTYAVGIVVDEDSSSRRLEVFIPGVVLAFDAGGVLTGTLTTPSVNIYGRDGSGATSAATTVASGGSVNFNGSSLAFSAASQIALVQAQGGILSDIITSIDNTGLSYTYTVILTNTAGTTHTFGHDVTGTFTGFPAAGGAEFVIAGSAADAATLSGGQKLTGSVTFGATGGGGGGGGDPIPPADVQDAIDTVDEVNDALTDLPADASVDEITDVVNNLNDIGATIGDALADGSLGVDSALDFLDAASVGADSVGAATQGGDADELEAGLDSITDLFDTTASILLILPDPSDSQLVQVNTASSNLISSLATAVTGSTLDEGSLDDAIESAADLLNGTITANNGNLTPNVLSSISELANALGGSGEVEIDLVPKIPDPMPPLPLLANSIGGGEQEDLIDQLNNFEFDEITIDDGSGGTESLLESVFDGLTGIDLEEIEEGLESSRSLLFTPESLAQLLGVDLQSLTLGNESDGNSEAAAGHLTDGIPVFVSSVAIVPSSIASGSTTAANGNILITSDGIQIELTPASADTIAFVAGVSDAAAEVDVLPGGGLSITDGTITVSATFGFGVVAGASDANDSAVTFAGPVSGNDESDANYFFTVNYPNGGSQALQPAMAEDAFFDSVAGFGFEVSADLATGIISIPGVGNFRPSYVVVPNSLNGLIFHAVNKDATGIAYRVLDANNDGVTDVEVYSQTTVQVLFGMP